jgi:hypothetical protein
MNNRKKELRSVVKALLAALLLLLDVGFFVGPQNLLYVRYVYFEIDQCRDNISFCQPMLSDWQRKNKLKARFWRRGSCLKQNLTINILDH